VGGLGTAVPPITATSVSFIFHITLFASIYPTDLSRLADAPWLPLRPLWLARLGVPQVGALRVHMIWVGQVIQSSGQWRKKDARCISTPLFPP